MKNHWITFFMGRVIVRVEGKGIERLLNMLVRSQIGIWNVRRQNEETAVFHIALTDLKRFRKIARKASCKIYFIRGAGVPFLWKRAMNNSGFIVGLVSFFLITLLLSNVTWGIEISGADPETDHKIRQELVNIGIKRGTLHWFGDKPDVIQQKLTDKIDNLTWVGVELRGTTYHFQVVQKTEPELAEKESPRHLVASKKAVIADMFVEKGKPLVKIHDFVEKNQLLVSGTIGNEDKQKNVVAKGKVWGLTWYQSKVEFPLKSSFQVYNGAEMSKHYIKFNNISIPVWGFGKIEYQKYEKEIDDRHVFFLGKRLPIYYSKEIIREKENLQRSLSKKEAIEAAKTFARRDLEMKIPTDAKVDKEIVLHEEVENGKVMLSINFQVIENIAKEKPIVQGD